MSLLLGSISPAAADNVASSYEAPNAKFTINIRSDAGDFVGGGKTYQYTNATADKIFVTLMDLTGDGVIDFLRFHYLDKNFGQFWDLDVATNELGKNIANGSYPKATRASFADPGTAGLDFGLNGAGCNTVVGDFTISNLVIDCMTTTSGATVAHLRSVTVIFDDHCEGATPAVHANFIFSDTSGLDCATGTGGGGGGGTGGTPTPPPAPTTPVVTFADGFFDQPVGIGNAQSVQVPFSVFVPDGFSSDVTLSASSAPEGLNFTFDNSFFPAPGSGDAVLTISAGPDTFPIDRQVAITATFNDASGNPVSSTSTFTVSLDCNPPLILGIDQPKNASVSNGATAQVTVKPTGSGPFRYQWFAGSTGQVHFPVSGGTGATLTTAPVNAATPYWVRVSNACGSADSNTVVVSPK